MKKENVKIALVEIVKLVFEFLIFRWGKSYDRVSKLCAGECFDSHSDLLKRGQSSLKRAGDDLRELSERAKEATRLDLSKDKDKSE